MMLSCLSVIDANLILSYSVDKNQKFNAIWSICFIKFKTLAEKIYISVLKINKLELSVNLSSSKSMEVYDGPGTLCQEISPIKSMNKIHYSLSQFQAVVFVYREVRIQISHIY